MSTQSDYSLTRAAVTLLAALLLTAGTAREAGAAGSLSSGDNVTGSGIPAVRAPNAAQRRAGAAPADAAYKPADMAVEVAAKSAGVAVNAAANSTDVAVNATAKSTGMTVNATAKSAGVAVNAAANSTDVAVNATAKSTGMTVNATAKSAGVAVDATAKSAGVAVDDAAKPQVLATEAASEPDVVAAGAGPDAAPAPLPPIRQSGFVYCVSGVVTTFNPQMASSGVTVDTLSAQLYDRLLAVDPYTYRLIPELAQRWEVLDNGATYRFHLRKNIAFQPTAWFTPTRTLNADDVVFSFARMFDVHHPWHAVNGGDYPYFDSLQFPQTVQSVKRIDNDTVEFRLESPDASFLWHLATHYAPVLSAEYADRLTASGHQEQLDRLPVGTGPFMLNEYYSGQFIRLTRHEHYWRGKPRMAQVVIDLSSGGIGRLSRLLTGECDVLAYPAASQLSILRDDPRLRLTLRPGMNIAYLAFNTRKPPLNDVRLRHAIALAINNPRLMQSIYYGTAETAASLLPRASWAYDNDARVTEYNPAKARALLRELGKPSLQLNLLVPTASQSYNPSPLKTAELIQADLAQVGIRLTIIPVEGRFQEARLTAVNHDMTLSGWSTDSNDPDSFFRPLLSCAAIGSQTNYARWCDPAFDALLHRALFSQQLASRIDAYHEAQRMLAQQLPVLPLASSLRLQAYRYGIRGLVLSPFGNASFAGVYRDERQEQTP